MLVSAKASGSDVTEAENLLELARQAQAVGDYAAAEQYAAQARQALEASATGTASPSAKAASSSDNTLPIAAGVIVLAALGYFAYTQMGGSGKK